MTAIRAGAVLRDVPDHPGVWSAWSMSDHSPGAWFLVPADDEARASGLTYLTARLTMSKFTGHAEVVKVLDS